MRALHGDACGTPGGLSADLLEKRLARERRARQAAEALLESKSRELHVAGEALKKAAASLEGQRTQLKLILDNTQAGIVFTRADLTIREMNDAARAMFGREEASITGLQDLFVGPSETLDWIKSLVGDDPEIEDTSHEVICRRSDDREFPAEFGVKPLEFEGRTHFVWFVRDITRRKREEEKRRSLEQELAQAQKFEALGTLASGVAHEINTPIQFVSDNLRFLSETLSDFGDLTDLSREALSEAQPDVQALKQRFFDKAEKIDLDFITDEAPEAARQSLEGLEQVASIVKAIKSFSHPGDEAIASVDLNDAISTTLTVSRNRWKYVAEVTTDFDDALGQVPCRPGDINQVLLNLVVNAADAIEESGGDGPGQIGIATRRKDGFAEIRVSDTGCGIPEEARDKIFDPFFTTKDVGKGSGQGLAISYSIVRQKHAGSIHFESEVGRGTTFIVRLPLDGQPEPSEI